VHTFGQVKLLLLKPNWIVTYWEAWTPYTHHAWLMHTTKQLLCLLDAHATCAGEPFTPASTTALTALQLQRQLRLSSSCAHKLHVLAARTRPNGTLGWTQQSSAPWQ
jgi:hypothetical protein